MLGNAAVYATSRTQHCVTLSTTEAEYAALAEETKEGMSVRSVMSSMQPNVYEITLMEDNDQQRQSTQRLPRRPRRGCLLDR